MSSSEIEQPYTVEITPYAKKHFIKDLVKKYHAKRWRLTQEGITAILRKPFFAIEKNDLETIVFDSNVRICKLEFKIFGSKNSAKKEGTRCIVALDTETKTARVLLVYHKNNVKGGKETAWWKKEIKNAFSEYEKIL